MADTAVNLFALSVGTALSGAGTPDGATGTTSPNDGVAGGAFANFGEFQPFDAMLSQAQQNDPQPAPQTNPQNTGSGQASASSQSSASDQSAASANAQKTSNDTEQSDEVGSHSQAFHKQASANSDTQNGPTAKGTGQPGKKQSTAASGSTDGTVLAAAAALQAPSDAASGASQSGTQDSIVQAAGLPGGTAAELQALLNYLSQLSGTGTQAATGQTGTDSNFLQMLQNLAGQGTQTSLSSLATDLQNFASSTGQALSATDLQQLSALMARFSAAAGLPSLNSTAVQADANAQQPQLSDLPSATDSAANTKPSATGQSVQNALDAARSLLQHPGTASTTTTTTQATNTSATTDSNTTGTSATLSASTSTSLDFSTSGGNTDSKGQDGSGSGQNAQAPLGIISLQPLALQTVGAGNTNGPTSFSQALDQVQQVQQASPADQVTAYVKSATQNGETRMEIQLHPAELGWVSVRLEVTPEGHASMTVTADKSETLNMLQSDVKSLTQILSDIGLKADAGSLSFNLRGDQQGQAQYQNPGQNSGQGSGRYSAQSVDPLEESLSQAAPQAYAVTQTDGVDIRA